MKIATIILTLGSLTLLACSGPDSENEHVLQTQMDALDKAQELNQLIDQSALRTREAIDEQSQ